MAKIGRNDACPCGSGRRHKTCCLSIVQTARAADDDYKELRRKLPQAIAAYHEQLGNTCNHIAAITEPGRTDEALRVALDAIENYPHEIMVYDLLCQVYEMRGDRDHALMWWRRALAVITAIEGYKQKHADQAKAHIKRLAGEGN